MYVVMVGGTPKPFACTTEGCSMTFTNEDHLNVHQRKHEMVLNFGMKNTNIVADQTPTPTRFLRNCEEVGLFQDLQNVNPFEETFRKAVELVKTGTLPVSILPEDDTLHTPHIFPHIPEENISLYSRKKIEKTTLMQTDDNAENNGKILSHSERTESILTLNTNHGIPDHIYALTPIHNHKEPPTIIISDSPEPHQVSLDSTKKSETFVLKSNNITTKHLNICDDKTISKAKYRKYIGNVNLKSNSNDTKSKLQQLLLQNKKQMQPAAQQTITTNAPVIVLQSVPVVNSVVPIIQTIGQVPILPKFESTTCAKEKLPPETIQSNKPTTTTTTTAATATATATTTKIKSKLKRNNIQVDTSKKEDLLARNRAAALRCRERKKVFIDSLEHQLDVANKEKQVLIKENADQKKEILHLKTLLLAHKDCPVTKAMNMGQSIPIGMPQIVEIANEIKIETKNSDATPVTISICDIKHLPTDTSPKQNVLIWED